MWDISWRFIGKHNARTTLSFGSHFQMAYTVLQMFIWTAACFFYVLAHHSLVQEKLSFYFHPYQINFLKVAGLFEHFKVKNNLDTRSAN